MIGVLGGMGPRATVDFYDKLVTHTPADTDQGHLPVVIWADPTVPSRQDAILGDGADPAPWLRRGIDRLLEAGAEILVVPCNTAHHFLLGLIPDEVEFLSIKDVTIAAVLRRQPAPVGLLATDAALASDLFQCALRAHGRDVVLPSPADQTQLTAVIHEIKAGVADTRTHARLSTIIDDLAGRGAGVTIAGCTEVSALLSAHPGQSEHDVVDPALELALAAIQRAQSPAPAPGSPNS